MSPGRKDRKTVTRRRLLRTAVYGGLALTAGVQWFEADRLKLERQTLKLKRWRADGFKLALLSDLHANNTHEAERAIRAIRMAAEEKPDVILFGGDFLNSSKDSALTNVAKVLDAADDAGIPSMAVLGNHDYWIATTRQLISAFEGRRTRLLRNEIVRVGDATIWGIDDGIAGRDRHELYGSRRDDPSLLALFHEPDFVTRVDKRVGLMLAGHSHGGQMCLPFGVALHTPRGAWRYIAGFYPDADAPLYVSRGIGTVGPAYRLFCPPEVTILTLTGGAEA